MVDFSKNKKNKHSKQDPYADPGLADLRLPPHSVEAEQSVIGGLLLDNAAFDKIADFLSVDDFYRHDHRLIFKHIVRLIELSRPADVVTVAEGLQSVGEDASVGGLAYLAQLVSNTPSSANIRRYAEIVRERAILRCLVTVGHEIADDAYNPSGREARELLDDAERKVFEIAESGTRGQGGLQDIKPILAQVLERITELHEAGHSEVTGTPTGFTDLDRMTAGLQPGDLIIVAGRPSMGKTAFALNIAEHVALDIGAPVGIFSMEMGSSQLALRVLASIGRLNQQRVRVGQLNDDEWERLTYAFGRLHEAPIHIDETGSLNPLDVRARARRLHRQYGGRLGLIVIDYLQLMVGAGRTENRATEISEISRSLKALAKELHCPIVALSQLSRKVEERNDKRPMMSDLRESGAIEQDADVILMMYRDEYYNKESQEKGIAEVNIGKQRNGPTGTVKLTFLGEFTRFENALLPGSY